MKIVQFLCITALVLFSWSFNTVQAQQDAKIAIQKTQIINASADDVWERLRQLDGLEQIIPNFLADSWIINDAAPGPGAKRSCSAPGTPKGKASYTEQVVEYDDEKRFYSYAVVEGIPAKNMLNSFKVIDLGYKKCMVVWTSEGGQFIKNPQMTKDQFVGFLDNASSAIMAGLVKLHDGK